MSSWPEQVVVTKQIKDYIDLERRTVQAYHRTSIIDSNLKNEYFNGNAPSNHINGNFSSGSIWFVMEDAEEN